MGQQLCESAMPQMTPPDNSDCGNFTSLLHRSAQTFPCTPKHKSSLKLIASCKAGGFAPKLKATIASQGFLLSWS